MVAFDISCHVRATVRDAVFPPLWYQPVVDGIIKRAFKERLWGRVGSFVRGKFVIPFLEPGVREN